MKGTLFLSKKKERTKIVYLKLQVRNSKSHIKVGLLVKHLSIFAETLKVRAYNDIFQDLKDQSCYCRLLCTTKHLTLLIEKEKLILVKKN